MTNKDKKKDGSMKTCNYNIDGECLTFDNYMTYEVCPDAVEYIANYQYILEKYCKATEE